MRIPQIAVRDADADRDHQRGERRDFDPENGERVVHGETRRDRRRSRRR